MSGGSVGWWYNWALQPDANVRSNPSIAGTMEHVPMVWTSKDVNVASVVAALKARPTVKDLLVVNEPNLTDQANLLPADAAVQWLKLEDIARQTGVRLIGPALNWGTMAGYSDPIVWMDAFLAAFRGANGRDPQIDALAFHWYDYGLADQLNRLKKYGKPFWVTEMANWHNGDGNAQIDTPAKQMEQMADMVRICESRSDVLRYSWFIGRMSPDPHFTSLLGAPGVLTDVGKQYKSLPKA
ncbi:glycosyl hydrolase [Roseateles chitinivorans]|uniref:glycosyl hydrolase n=1 Tax=Roseateles chitinivorans TaxID=2917965 RepID=UPI003D67CBD5